jgi:membrane-bound lytic murein transglycosylase D
MRAGILIQRVFVFVGLFFLISCGASRETRVPVPSSPASGSPGADASAKSPEAIPPPVVEASAQVIKPATASPEAMNDKANRILIEVERLSAQGRKKLKEQHLLQAKTDLEAALDLILSSGVDLRRHSRLKQNFDEIFNFLYQIEGQMASSETDQAENQKTDVKPNGKGEPGKGESEQEANGENGDQDLEPAAIDELEGVNVFPLTIESDLQERVVEDIANTKYDIPVIVNEPVLRWLEYFKTKGRRIVELGLKRIGLYREMIHSVFSEAGIPKDLIYIAQQESMFKPLAQSRSRARGMWQFMLRTGRQYGLKQDNYIDEKLDPEKSTRAAAKHLQTLYQMFGDWYLAMAAYNAGEGRIQRIIEKTKVTNFWDLSDRKLLREQTASYVPSILAFMIIGKHPEKYGFQVEPMPSVQIKKITVPSPVDLSVAASTVGLSMQRLHELNPELRRRVTPANRKNYDLNVPEDITQEIALKLSALPITKRIPPAMGASELASAHKVQQGDSLWNIARHYGTTVEKLKEANHLLSNRLSLGQQLVIPGRLEKSPVAVVAKGKTDPSKGASAKAISTVKTASNAKSISSPVGKNAGETNNKLPTENKATPTQTVAMNAESGSNGDKTITHRVRRGDNLYNIARRYKTSVDLVRQWNKLFSDSLHPGDTLLIYLP